MIQVGNVLRGRYRIESLIGRGGMGEVFAATTIDPRIVYDETVVPGRRVAIKVVSRRVLGEVLMARLQREAIAAVRVQSDFVPQVLDVDTTEDGEVFLVMELLRGQTLAERLRRRGGTLNWEEVAAMGEDVLQGLIDAHAAGVIHRDLKPSNIFLETRRSPGLRERAKILDFGVCKLDTPDEERLTSTGEAVGTVAYMAPEQIRGASKVDARADLYSFAAVVFETLAGRLAYEGPGQMALLANKLERDAVPLDGVIQVAHPPRLGQLVGSLLARNPDDRPSSAMDVLAEWRALGPPTDEAATLAAVRTDLPELPVATQTSLSSGTMTRLGQKPSRASVAAALAILVAAGLALALVVGAQSRRATASAPEEPISAYVPTSAADPPPPAEPGTPPETVSVPTLELPADEPQAEVQDVDAAPKRPGRTGVPTRPGHGPKKPSEPHITDKPRY